MVGPPCWTRWSDQKCWTRLIVGPEVWSALWLDQVVGPEVRSDQKYGRTRSMVSVMVEPGGRTRSLVGPEVWSDQTYGRTRSMVGTDLSHQKKIWSDHYGETTIMVRFDLIRGASIIADFLIIFCVRKCLPLRH